MLNLEVFSISAMYLNFFFCLQSYVKIYQKGELPEPMTMLRATAEANNLAALAAAKEKYVEEMRKVGYFQTHSLSFTLSLSLSLCLTLSFFFSVYLSIYPSIPSPFVYVSLHNYLNLI